MVDSSELRGRRAPFAWAVLGLALLGAALLFRPSRREETPRQAPEARSPSSAPVIDVHPERRPGSIVGRVSHAGTGGPLKGVSLDLAGGRGVQSHRSASDGHFAFNELPPGSYVLSARLNASAAPVRVGELDVRAGEAFSCDVRLKPGRVVSGTARASDGRRVDRFELQAVWPALGVAESDACDVDEDGLYQIPLANEAGDVWIVARAAGYAPAKAGPVSSSSDRADLFFGKGGGILARVVDESGRGLGKVRVRWVSENQIDFYEALSEEDGSLHLKELPPGAFDAYIEDPAFVSEKAAASVRVHEGADAGPVTLTARVGKTLGGRVLEAATGKSIAGARIRIDTGHARYSAASDGQGRYVIRGVDPAGETPGLLDIRCEADGYAPFASRGAWTDPFDIRLENGGRVVVRVSLDKPDDVKSLEWTLSIQAAAALPSGERPRAYMVLVKGSEGSSGDLPPGPYDIVVRASGYADWIGKGVYVPSGPPILLQAPLAAGASSPPPGVLLLTEKDAEENAQIIAELLKGMSPEERAPMLDHVRSLLRHCKPESAKRRALEKLLEDLK
jgi:hypothetical protein